MWLQLGKGGAPRGPQSLASTAPVPYARANLTRECRDRNAAACSGACAQTVYRSLARLACMASDCGVAGVGERGLSTGVLVGAGVVLVAEAGMLVPGKVNKPPLPSLSPYVGHVANLGGVAQLQHLLELLGQRHLHRLVGGGPGPERDAELLGADVDHRATHLLALVKLLADAGQDLGVERVREGGGGRPPGVRSTERCRRCPPVARHRHRWPKKPTTWSQLVSSRPAAAPEEPRGMRKDHLPPLAQAGSSHLGSMPSRNRWMSAPVARRDGGRMLLYRLHKGARA